MIKTAEILDDISENHGQFEHPREGSVSTRYGGLRMRLNTIIRGFFAWLVRFSWQLFNPDAWNQIRPTLFGVSRNHMPPRQRYWRLGWQKPCFLSMIMCLILKHDSEIRSEVISNPGMLADLPTPPAESFHYELEPKIAVLQLYHSRCSFKLENYNRMETGPEPRKYYYIESLMDISARLARLSRVDASDPYTSKQEDIDRLLQVCKEVFQSSSLPWESLELRSNSWANDRIGEISSRVYGRLATTVINPGTQNSDDSTSDLSVEPPWELALLNHHTALRVAFEAPYSIPLSIIKEKCSRFMSTEFMFLKTWNRSDSKLCQSWWDIDPPAVICATILDLLTPTEGKEHPVETCIKLSKCTGPSAIPLDIVHHGVPFSPKETLRVIGWSESISRRIFMDDWIHSLDDTPERFRQNQTNKISLQHSLKNYLKESGQVESPDYSWENISDLIPSENLLHLSLSDLGYSEQNEIDEIMKMGHHKDPSFLNIFTDFFFSKLLKQYPALLHYNGQSDIKRDLSEFILSGYPWGSFHPFRQKLKSLTSLPELPKLKEERFRSYQKTLLHYLSDSVRA